MEILKWYKTPKLKGIRMFWSAWRIWCKIKSLPNPQGGDGVACKVSTKQKFGESKIRIYWSKLFGSILKKWDIREPRVGKPSVTYFACWDGTIVKEVDDEVRPVCHRYIYLRLVISSSHHLVIAQQSPRG